MIILSNPINLYGKKVITDLATRTGIATLDDYSYGLGMNYIVQRYLTDKETDVNLEMLFNDMTDYNPDIKQPVKRDEEEDDLDDIRDNDLGIVYNPAKDPVDFDRYCRRLEDIDSEYLEMYLGNLTYSAMYSSTGLKAYNSKHMSQPTLCGNEGDDDFTELSDLLIDDTSDGWSLDAKQTALQNLPYVLKRLHNMSCYTKVHVLSYVAAFKKAQDKNIQKRMSGSSMVLKKNAVIQEGVYLCNSAGYITKKVEVENKNVRMAEMFDWMVGVNKNYPAYRKDVDDFLHYCEVLNIDIVNDDMSKYSADFIDKLIVTTVTPNSQYDRQVFDTILSNGTTLPTVEEEVDAFSNTFDLFQQICSVNPKIHEYIMQHDSVQMKLNFENAKSLHNMYSILYTGNPTSNNDYSWENGYLHYKDEIVVMPANILGVSQFDDNRCIINELGYCIHLSSHMSLHLLSITSTIDNLRNKAITKDNEYKYVDWVRFSV